MIDNRVYTRISTCSLSVEYGAKSFFRGIFARGEKAGQRHGGMLLRICSLPIFFPTPATC